MDAGRHHRLSALQPAGHQHAVVIGGAEDDGVQSTWEVLVSTIHTCACPSWLTMAVRGTRDGGLALDVWRQHRRRHPQAQGAVGIGHRNPGRVGAGHAVGVRRQFAQGAAVGLAGCAPDRDLQGFGLAQFLHPGLNADLHLPFPSAATVITCWLAPTTCPVSALMAVTSRRGRPAGRCQPRFLARDSAAGRGPT